MRRCYTTKVWEELLDDVALPGYAAYLVESAFRRLEFDVYEHVRMLFSVEATSDELMAILERHHHVVHTPTGRGKYLLSLNLRTLTEMARRIHCDGRECAPLVKFLGEASPTIERCIRNAPSGAQPLGSKPSSTGQSETDFRIIVVQYLSLGKVRDYAGTALALDDLLRHSFMTAEVEGVSRACSHQLVRHRLFSYSQESQRFSDAVSEGAVIPPSVKANPEAVKVFERYVADSKEGYSRLRALGIKKEDARFLLPAATKTKVLLTGPMWQVYHAGFYRSSFSDVGEKAQWEINRLFTELYSCLMKKDELLPPRIGEL